MDIVFVDGQSEQTSCAAIWRYNQLSSVLSCFSYFNFFAAYIMYKHSLSLYYLHRCPLTSQTQYPTEFIMFHDRPLSTHQQLSQVSLRWTLQYERCILGPWLVLEVSSFYWWISSLLLTVLVIFSCFIISTHKEFYHNKKLITSTFSRPKPQQIYHPFVSLVHV